MKRGAGQQPSEQWATRGIINLFKMCTSFALSKVEICLTQFIADLAFSYDAVLAHFVQARLALSHPGYREQAGGYNGAESRLALFLQNFGYFIIDGLNLALGLTAAEHKIIGEAAYPAGIEQNNVNSLLVTGGGYRFMSYL